MGILNRQAIKQEAKLFISTDRKWVSMFFACVIFYLFDQGIKVVNGAYNGVNYGTNFFENIDANVSVNFNPTSFISLILIPFSFAVAGYYLNHIRGFNPEWKSIYKEGFDNYGNYLTVGLVTNIFIFLWTLLFIFPGIIKTYAYSQVRYIMHDNHSLKPKEAMKMSDIMTKGFKSELFVLDLSFILWYLFVGITAGIGAIYVYPYIEITKAMYYENLKKNAIDTGLIAPEAFGMVPVTAYQPEFEMENSSYEPFSFRQSEQSSEAPETAYSEPEATASDDVETEDSDVEIFVEPSDDE